MWKALVLALLVLCLVSAIPPDPAPPEEVHSVHLLFSHHLDVGLNIGLDLTEFCLGFATKIVQEYFDDFIPRAIRLAQETRGTENQFAYTIHPWIASLYVNCVPWSIPDGCALNPGTLRCPHAAQIADFDQAVLRGDLLWADSPFNLDAGVVGDPGMFAGMMDIAGELNERYNLSKQQRVWSNVDVPGFVRSAIPAVRRAGATALSVCANIGSHHNSSAVPAEFVGNRNATMFRWHDPLSDEEILVLYHQSQSDTAWDIPISSTFDTYGGYTRPDNIIITPSGLALASFIASDNTGPPLTVNEVRAIFKKVRSIFPNAKVFSSTWDAFVREISPAEVASLPQYSSEWGDEWLTGMSTDPVRLSTYRSIVRARARCMELGKCQMKDPVIRNMTRFAAKISEHTQGVQGGGWSPGAQSCIWHDILHTPCVGDKHWKNEDFRKVHNSKTNVFHGADDSWLEARLFNTLAIEAVPPTHALYSFLMDELAGLQPKLPPSSLQSKPVVEAPAEVICQSRMVPADVVSLSFTQSGSIASLKFGSSIEWTNLMDLRYITSAGDQGHHLRCNQSFCPNPVAGAWSPSMVSISSDASTNRSSEVCHISVQLQFNDTLHQDYGSPSGAVVLYTVDPSNMQLNATVIWENKTTTRLPEAITVFNTPAMKDGYRWLINSLGEWVSPANVTPGGEQFMHALWGGIKYSPVLPSAALSTPGLWIGSLDAAMACPVLNKVAQSTLTPELSFQRNCFDYRTVAAGPDPQLTDAMIDGLGINLYNNRMGISGFAQWYPFGVGNRYQKQDETAQFRFMIKEV